MQVYTFLVKVLFAWRLIILLFSVTNMETSFIVPCEVGSVTFSAPRECSHFGTIAQRRCPLQKKYAHSLTLSHDQLHSLSLTFVCECVYYIYRYAYILYVLKTCTPHPGCYSLFPSYGGHLSICHSQRSISFFLRATKFNTVYL